jgi:hypothetical protein
MDPQSASSSSRMAWARALIAGLGLSLLWSNAEDDHRRLLVAPSSTNASTGLRGVDATHVAELLRVGSRVIAAAEALAKGGSHVAVRACGRELSQRYRQVAADLNILTNRVANGVISAMEKEILSQSPDSSAVGVRAVLTYGTGPHSTLPPTPQQSRAPASSATLHPVVKETNPSLESRQPSSFGPAVGRDQEALKCLNSALGTALKAYSNPDLQQLHPSLGHFAARTVVHLAADEDRVQAMLREEEVFSRSRADGPNTGFFKQPF